MSKPSGKKRPARAASDEPGEPSPQVVEQDGASPGNPNFPDRPDMQEKKARTLYLKLDGDGNPEWSRLTPASMDTWKGVFNHPATAGAFNAEPRPPEDRGAKPADAEAMLGWLAYGNAILLSRLSRLPLQETAEICKWTPEEMDSLSPRLQRLANKYGGEFLMKYGDEIFLVGTLTQAMGQRFIYAMRLAAARAQAEKEAPVDEAEAKPAGEVVQ